MTRPDFSSVAGQYARTRPRYPAELFASLAALLDRRQLAWDCATGSGQAALDLVEHFDRVIATDISAEQIHHASPHPRIEYRVGSSEDSGLDAGSVDLVAVASALHWFDLARFYAEARRVLRSGGVLAAWTYHVGYVEPPLDRVFLRFYREVLAPHFAPGARLVDERYESITLPGEPIALAGLHVSAEWNLDQLIAFIGSWSGTQQYLKNRGEDPVALIAEDLEHLWGERGKVRTVRWPLFVKVARL